MASGVQSAVPSRYPNDRHVPLTQGAYQTRSVIAEAQRCVNLYIEPNPQDAEAPSTHYPIPGLRVLSYPGDTAGDSPGQGRGLYRATNDQLFAVIGTSVFYIDPNFFFHRLGFLAHQRTTPVGMTDNGQTLLIVDGSPIGYEVDLVSHVLTQITDPNFLGADRIDFLSTFVISNIPGTTEFQSTHSGAPLVWDGLYIGSKIGFPDPLQTLIVMHLEIWLLGRLTTEIWYNAGGATFPFALFPGTFIEHGCAAKYSVQKHDLRVFWLSQDKDGRAIVVMGENYKAKRISTFAIEEALGRYETISDCVADIYQFKGHIFYRMHFPTADATWVYDAQTNEWHEIESTDDQGNTHRARDCFATAAYGKNVSLDWQSGALYELAEDYFLDSGRPRTYRRSWPHILSNGARMNYLSFIADMETGEYAAAVNDPIAPPNVELTATGSGVQVNVRAAYTYVTSEGGETLISPEVVVSNASSTTDDITFHSPPPDMGGEEGAAGWIPYLAVNTGAIPPAAGTETRQGVVPLGIGFDWKTKNGITPGAPPPNANTTGDSLPLVYLRWSDDRGKTWSQPISQSMGSLGNFLTQAKWWRLGQARDRVFELYWSVPVLGALNGAWIDAMPLAS